MSENLEPVAQPPAPQPTYTAPAAPAKKSPLLWVGVTGAAVVAALGGFLVGQNQSHGDRIDRVSFNGKMSQDGPGMQDGSGKQRGQGGPGMMPMGPHCENTSGEHAAVNADGSCPTGFTLDDRGGKSGMKPQPSASASASTS